LLLGVVLVLAIALPAMAQLGQVNRQPTLRLATKLQVVKLSELSLARRAQLAGQKIAVEGDYYDGSVPMVVDDINRTRMDQIMPEESYIALDKPLADVKAGDKIQVEGTIARIGTAPFRFQAQAKPKLVAATSLKFAPAAKLQISSALLEAIKNGLLLAPNKYAVLIVGGWDPYNNHMRYWNDLKTMYAILRARGYAAANIYVIYADGAAKDSSTPVNFSATIANVNAVFTTLAAKMKVNDTLYIMLNDHGGQGGDPNGDEADHIDEQLCLWGQNMPDDDFAAAVGKVKNYKEMIIQMKQCFCGGFIKELTAPNRIVMSSSRESEVSWGHSSGNYGEFTYHYFSALTGNKPDGSGAVNADSNGDGKVSILEAYNFARSHDTASEHPNYEDNGVVPSHEGAMPGGGEGALGAATFLQ